MIYNYAEKEVYLLVYCSARWITILMCKRDTVACSIVVIQVKHFQNELMFEISSESLVRANGKVLLMKFCRNSDEKWPLFVNKQLFWWSAPITLDNNNALLKGLCPFFSLNTLPHTSVGLTSCISIVQFEYFDSFDHYAACWVTLILVSRTVRTSSKLHCTF